MDSAAYTNKPGASTHNHQHSTTNILTSAKVVASAAKSTIRHENEKIDRARVAGAAGDLLTAACQYGKLEEKSFGKYVGKAETYLHQYNSSHLSSSSTTAHYPTASTTAHSSPNSMTAGSGSHSEEGGGLSDYLKLAEGFLKKHRVIFYHF